MKHGEGRYVKEGEEVVHGVWDAGAIVSRYNNKVGERSEDVKNNRSNHSTRTEEIY